MDPRLRGDDKRMKIIIIEDDHFFQNFYSLKLKDLGYEVEVANDGKEGIEKIKSFFRFNFA